MKNKKVMALLCAVSLTISSMLAGCGSVGTKESTSQSTSSASSDQSSASKEESSASKEDVVTTVSGYDGKGETLVVGIASDSLVTDFENNEFTKLLEEHLNINLEFYMLPADGGDKETKLSLMAGGGGEVPDVIATGLGINFVNNLGSNGFLIPLNDYLSDESMNPHFMAIPEKYRQEMLMASTAPDGNIYCLTTHNTNSWNSFPNRIYINKAWLDKLNLNVPRTTDELYEVLKAFANEDPNGNGKKDEIAAYGFDGTYGQNVVDTLMNAFVFYNGGRQNAGLALAEDGKTVVAPFVTDQYREGLKYLNKLCEEGLLAESVFTDDSNQFSAMLNAEEPIVGFVSAGSYGNWSDWANNPNFAQMELIAPLEGPQGICYSPSVSYAPGPSYFITSECKNPELAYRVGEYFYDEFISFSNRYGVEGLDWTIDPEVCKKYTPVTAQAVSQSRDVDMVYIYKTTRDVWLEASNACWRGAGNAYFKYDLLTTKGNTEPDESAKETLNYKRGLQFYSSYSDKLRPEKLLPLLRYTEEETQKVTTIMTDIANLVDTAMAEFIVGQRTLDDAGWNEYLKSLEQVGLKDFLSIAQTSYDRVAQ